MRVLNNPILGTILSRYSLILNEDGLHRKIVVPNRAPHLLFLTKDHVKICEILGLDEPRFSAVQNEEAFTLIMCAKTFTQYLFVGKPETSCELLQSFRNFVEKNLLEENPHIPITTSYIEEILNIELKDAIEERTRIINEYPLAKKTKFDAMKVALIREGYNPQNFSKHLPLFNDSFKGEIEYKTFFVDKTVAEILVHYMNIVRKTDLQLN